MSKEGPISTAKTQSSTVGIKKTKLMELGEYYGDTGLMNPRSIDPLVYMLAERGESVFGKKFIENCQEHIALSNSGFPKQKSLRFLADQMVRNYISTAFNNVGKSDIAHYLKNMPALDQSSYVDYFLLVSKMERDSFRTPIHAAVKNMEKLVAGYQTEQPGQVCDVIVQFFELTKNQVGLENLLKDLCDVIKKRV